MKLIRRLWKWYWLRVDEVRGHPLFNLPTEEEFEGRGLWHRKDHYER